MMETLALNPISGVVHQWHCGLGPARGGLAAPYAGGYVAVPTVVLHSIRPESICTRCLPQEVAA